MKIGLLLLGVLALALGGCTSSPAAPKLETALTWEAPNAERVDCSELLAEWSDGQEGSPQGCWRYLAGYNSAEPKRAQFASFIEYVGVKPDVEPVCVGDSVSCMAIWKTSDGYLWLSSGINIEGLKQRLDNPEAADLVHELLVYTGDTDPSAGSIVEWEPLD